MYFAFEKLSQVAISGSGLRRYGARAIELAPDNSSVEVISLNLTYADAIDEAAHENAQRHRQLSLPVDAG
jgi:hypothetical protein